MKARKVISFAAVFLLVLFKYLEMWTFLIYGEYMKSLFIIFFVAFAVIVVLASHHKNNYDVKKIILFFAICSIISILTSTINYIVAFIIAILYYDKSKDNIISLIKCYIIALSICYFFTIFLYLIGVVPSVTSVRITDEGVKLRDSLGFFNANSVLLYFSPIALSCLGLTVGCRKGKKCLIFLIVAVVSMVLFLETDCRTGLFAMSVALLLYLFSGLLNKKVVKLLMKEYLPIFLALSFILAISFGGTIENPVNKVLTNRPYFWLNGYIKPYGFTLLGGKIDEYALDNAYLYLYYGGGLVSFLLYLYITKKSSRIICNNPSLLYILITTSIFGLAEQNINYCVNIVLAIQIFYCISHDSLLRIAEGGKG